MGEANFERNSENPSLGNDRLLKSSRNSRKMLSGKINFVEDCLPAQLEIDKVNSIKKFLKQKYDVELTFQSEKSKGGGAIINPVTEPWQSKILQNLKDQIVKVPPSLFKKMRIAELRLTGKMVTEDGKYLVGAMIDPMPKSYTQMHFRYAWTIFHEIYHQIDSQTGGKATMRVNIPNSLANLLVPGSGDMEETLLKDFNLNPVSNTDWGKLDPKEHERLSNKKDFDIHKYYDEEQAEYSRFLFNLDNPEILNDKYIPLTKTSGGRAKIAKMKQLLHSYSDGLLDERYWKDLKDGKVDENYWMRRGVE